MSMLVRRESACARGTWENGWNARGSPRTCNINRNAINFHSSFVQSKEYLGPSKESLYLAWLHFPFTIKESMNSLLFEMSLIPICISALKIVLQTTFFIASGGSGRGQSPWTVMNLEETQASSDTGRANHYTYIPVLQICPGEEKVFQDPAGDSNCLQPPLHYLWLLAPSPSWEIHQISASHKHPSLAGSSWNSDGMQTPMTPQENLGKVTNNIECLSLPWTCTTIKGSIRISCNLAGQYISYHSSCQSKAIFWGGGKSTKTVKWRT